MSTFEPIFRDAVAGVAGVVIYDKGHVNLLGRYVVAKSMRLPNGKFRMHQTYYCQRPAAFNYAKKWLAERAEKAGKTYVDGDGKNTWGFKPISQTQ